MIDQGPTCSGLTRPRRVLILGGGFGGVATIGGMNDFVREALPYYPDLRKVGT